MAQSFGGSPLSALWVGGLGYRPAGRRDARGPVDHGPAVREAALRCVVCGGPAFDCSCVRSALETAALRGAVDAVCGVPG